MHWIPDEALQHCDDSWHLPPRGTQELPEGLPHTSPASALLAGMQLPAQQSVVLSQLTPVPLQGASAQ